MKYRNPTAVPKVSRITRALRAVDLPLCARLDLVIAPMAKTRATIDPMAQAKKQRPAIRLMEPGTWPPVKALRTTNTHAIAPISATAQLRSGVSSVDEGLGCVLLVISEL